MRNEPTRGALDGLRVVDFGQYIAGPLVAQLLADYGADVVRVDPPSGPIWKADANAILQRGKRSIVLDLKRLQDADVARRLVDRADVVIENFRPGVMDRLGFGSADALARNRRLIYCSLPGFASSDPRAGVYADEGVLAAVAGLYPGLDWDPSGEPVVNTLPLASVAGALIAAHSIAAALVARERSGLGQRIEVSLFEAAYELTRFYGDRGPGGGASRVRQLGGSHQIPIARSYECQDGRWVRVSWLEGRQTEDFAKLVGKRDLWKSMGLLDLSKQRMMQPDAAGDSLALEVAAVFKTQPAAYWERVAGQIADLIIIQSTEDWLLYDEQARAIGGTIVRIDPELGVTHQGGSPVTMTRTPPNPGNRGPVGGDRDEILFELERLPSPEPVEDGADEVKLQAALEGIRAVDATVLLAGPIAGRVLAEYGADVIHVGNPHWKGMDQFHFSVHSGKRSTMLDLKDPAAGRVFRELVQRADVLSTNFSQTVAGRLGVDEGTVRQYNSDIIYSRISAHGVFGPRCEYRGHEEVGQAVTGALMRFGHSPAGNMQFFPINDVGTGHLAAFAIIMALYHRLRTGQGQFIGASLAQTCVTWSTPYMVAHRARDWTDPGGLDFRGYDPLHRVYKASDGRWFFLAVQPSASLAALAKVPGLEGVEAVDPTAVQATLDARFATAPAEQWINSINAFADYGLGAGIQSTLEEVMQDKWARSHGVVREVDFSHAGSGRLVAPSPRLSRTPVKMGRPVGPPGCDSRQILSETGSQEQAGQQTEKRATGVPR